MNVPMRHAGIITALVSVLSATAIWGKDGYRSVPLDDPDIHYRGIRHVSVSADLVQFSRFDPALLEHGKSELGFNPVKARNTTGGTIAFRSATRSVRMRFRSTPGLDRGSEFGMYIDGRLLPSLRFKPRQEFMELEFESDPGDAPVSWELTLPSFANPELLSLEIEAGTRLLPLEETGRGVYVALGDSISHGTGQGSATHLTWPHLLSRKLDMSLYNLSVGGSGVSVTAGRSLASLNRVDLVTVLIGYNDWNGEGDSVAAFREQYRELLGAIRASHPDTPVVCISPLFTRRAVSRSSGLAISDFRAAVRQLVTEWRETDPNIYFVAGEDISSEANLRPPENGDPVHLSVEGAALLAEALFPVVRRTMP